MKNLFVVLFFLVGLFSIGSSYAEESLLFSEDFSGNLSKWQIEGSPSPSIVSSEGNPAPSFCTNDDLNYGGWAVSKDGFDYSNGLSISVDLKPGQASFPDQRRAMFRLLQDNSLYTEGSKIKLAPYLISVRLTADNYRTTPGFSEVTPGPWISFYIRGEEELEEALEIPIDSGSGWHNLKIEINDTQKVAFYLDNKLIYTSTNSISLAYSGSAALGLGTRLCYHDNVQVYSGSSSNYNCDQIPSVIEPIYPFNDVAIIPQLPNKPFSWYEDECATEYQLYIEKDDSAIPLLDISLSLDEVNCTNGMCEYTPEIDYWGTGNFEWFIRGNNSYGYGDWSERTPFFVQDWEDFYLFAFDLCETGQQLSQFAELLKVLVTNAIKLNPTQFIVEVDYCNLTMKLGVFSRVVAQNLAVLFYNIDNILKTNLLDQFVQQMGGYGPLTYEDFNFKTNEFIPSLDED